MGDFWPILAILSVGFSILLAWNVLVIWFFGPDFRVPLLRSQLASSSVLLSLVILLTYAATFGIVSLGGCEGGIKQFSCTSLPAGFWGLLVGSQLFLTFALICIGPIAIFTALAAEVTVRMKAN